MPLIFLFISAFFLPTKLQNAVHPVYVSVTHIDHNQKEKTLEITCRVFTNDYEKVLRKLYKGKVDLLANTQKQRMDSLTAAYMLSHLQLTVNGKKVVPEFLGFEQETDGILNYLEVAGIDSVNDITMLNTILYDLWEKQENVIHVTAGGKRKSIRLYNPTSSVSFQF